jgi:hypothetical protein
MRRITIAILAICLLWTIPALAVELRAGYFFNATDGERKPIVATPLKTWGNMQIKSFKLSGALSLDFWATDLDQLTKGLQEDWSGGLDIAYTLPIELAEGKINLSIGYGIGARSPLSDEAEFIHGATVFGISYKF